jgi:hypothetical protein
MNGMQGTAQQQSRGVEHSINMAEIALRGTQTIVDIQLAAMRNLFQLQARSATMFGLPDCSELFGVTDSLIKSQLSAGTDQILNSTRQIAQTLADTQRQFGQVVQQDTQHIAEEIRRSIEEVGERTRQGMRELTDITRMRASEAESGMQAMNRPGRNGGDQPAEQQAAQRKQPGQPLK